MESTASSRRTNPPVSLTPFKFTVTSESRTDPSKLCSKCARIKKQSVPLPNFDQCTVQTKKVKLALTSNEAASIGNSNAQIIEADYSSSVKSSCGSASSILSSGEQSGQSEESAIVISESPDHSATIPVVRNIPSQIKSVKDETSSSDDNVVVIQSSTKTVPSHQSKPPLILTKKVNSVVSVICSAPAKEDQNINSMAAESGTLRKRPRPQSSASGDTPSAKKMQTASSLETSSQKVIRSTSSLNGSSVPPNSKVETKSVEDRNTVKSDEEKFICIATTCSTPVRSNQISATPLKCSDALKQPVSSASTFEKPVSKAHNVPIACQDHSKTSVIVRSADSLKSLSTGNAPSIPLGSPSVGSSSNPQKNQVCISYDNHYQPSVVVNSKRTSFLSQNSQSDSAASGGQICQLKPGAPSSVPAASEVSTAISASSLTPSNVGQVNLGDLRHTSVATTATTSLNAATTPLNVATTMPVSLASSHVVNTPVTQKGRLTSSNPVGSIGSVITAAPVSTTTKATQRGRYMPATVAQSSVAGSTSAIVAPTTLSRAGQKNPISNATVTAPLPLSSSRFSSLTTSTTGRMKVSLLPSNTAVYSSAVTTIPPSNVAQAGQNTMVTFPSSNTVGSSSTTTTMSFSSVGQKAMVSFPSSSTVVSSSTTATMSLSSVAQAGQKTFPPSNTAVAQTTSMPSAASLRSLPTSASSPGLASPLPAALSNIGNHFPSGRKLPSTLQEPVATAKTALPCSTATVSSWSLQEGPSRSSSTTSQPELNTDHQLSRGSDSAIEADLFSPSTQGPETSSFRILSNLPNSGRHDSLDSAIEADQISPEIEDEIEAEFQRGLANGLVKLHITKCGVSGPPDTGKSHVRALMLGLPRPKQRRSTALATEADQATPDYSRFVDEDVVDVKKTGKGVTMWRVIKNDSMARVIANTLHNEDYSSIGEGEQVSCVSQQLHKKYKLILEIKKHLRRMKGKPKRKRKGLNGIHLVYFVDTGGQPQFQEILPNFIKCDINLLVHNLSQGLDYCPEFDYVVEGKKYSVPEQIKMSNISIIEQSVRSITSSIVSLQRKPHVAIIGTFKDHCNPGSAGYTNMLRAKSKEINEQLKPYTGTSADKCNFFSPQRSVEQRIFAVDGSEAGWIENQESLEKLKSLIHDCCEKRSVEVPIKYFIFLQNLLEYANKQSLQYITLAECQYVASTSNISMNTTDVHKALNLFSDCNIILYFPKILVDFVFIKPGFLFGKVTDLIVASFQYESDLMPDCRAAFQKTGVFNSQILDDIRLPSGKFTRSDFLSLLKGLFIIAELSNGSYFMPCVLPPVESSMSTELQEYKTCMRQNGIDGPFVISFTNGMSPRGLFCSLLVALAENPAWNLKDSGHTEIFRCRNLIEFEYYTAPTEHNSAVLVAVLDRQSRLEIYTACEKHYCSAIRMAICEALNSACGNMDYNHEHLYNTGFICRMDCGHEMLHATKVLTQNVLKKESCLLNLRKRAVELSLDRAIWFEEHVSHDVGPSVLRLCSEVATRTIQWEQIAMSLDLSMVDINRIRMENSGDIMACFTKVFENWHRKCIHPKWAKIIDVLESDLVGESVLGHELRSKYL